MRGKDCCKVPNQGSRMRLVPKPQMGRPHCGGQGNQARELAYARYNAMVEGVLEGLRLAGYLSLRPLYRWPGEERWCIGDWDRVAARKRPLVEVDLDFGDDGQPSRFLCRVGGRTASAALTEADLIRVLMDLHSSRIG